MMRSQSPRQSIVLQRVSVVVVLPDIAPDWRLYHLFCECIGGVIQY